MHALEKKYVGMFLSKIIHYLSKADSSIMIHKQAENVQVVPISEEYIGSYHSCLDSIAHERLYLGMVRAPPFDLIREFVLSNIRNNYPQFVAVEGKRIVGWCDIIPQKLEGFTHCGILGIGVLKRYRRKGIGESLLMTTMSAAKDFGIERVVLVVFASNTPAIKLFEKWGFVCEGIKKRSRKLDGKFNDVLLMSLCT
jgi:ribosomal protein S18 acetylase RimI-like enzyme